MEFEWDANKAAENQRKHGVSFDEATTVFGDPLSLTYADPDLSLTEFRYLTFGYSASGRALVISHTERAAKIRLISAREMTRKEVGDYEDL